MVPGEPVANGLPITQVLPWTWDVEKKHWYHMYEYDMPVLGEPIHWTGWGQNWNHMCVDCHVTHYDKGFNSDIMRYRSTMSVDHVSCMACHGEKDCTRLSNAKVGDPILLKVTPGGLETNVHFPVLGPKSGFESYSSTYT